MAIADLSSGAMAFPDERSVPCLDIFPHRVDERCVPAPSVGPGHAYAAFQQVKCCLASHAAALGDIIRTAVSGAGARVYNDNLERRKRVADALEFGFNILCGCDIAVGKMPEVELHSWLEAPVERHLVDGDRALAVVHRLSEMPRRVEVGRAMCRQTNPFD